jgi:hypothetical protein
MAATFQQPGVDMDTLMRMVAGAEAEVDGAAVTAQRLRTEADDEARMEAELQRENSLLATTAMQQG